MKNWDWRAVPEELPFPDEVEAELFLPLMLKMVCMLEGRRNKVGPEERTDERRGWQNTSA
jgi:hypothetical protein